MKLNPNLILEDERILLRPMSPSDQEEMQAMAKTPDLWLFFTHDLSDPEGFQAWCLPALAGDRLQLVAIDKNSGGIIGSSGFGNYSERDSRIEIGWTWIGKAFHGLGYNQHMKKLMLTYCFETLQLDRVEFKTDVLNLPARKALKNINAVEEGVLRSHTLMTRGRRRDTLYFSILRNEWEFVKRENEW